MPSVSSPSSDSRSSISLHVPQSLDLPSCSESIRKYAHRGEPRSIAFSSDGTLLVVGTEAGSIHLWDVASGKPARAPLEDNDMGAIFAVAIAHNGTLVAGGGADNILRIWNITESKDGSEPVRCKGHSDWIQSIEFSPDGKLLASASLDQTARLWNVQTGRAASAALKGHTSHVFKALFTPLGNQLVTGSADGTLKIWGATSPASAPRCRRTIEAAPSNRCLALSPSGSIMATSNADGSVIELRNLNNRLVAELGRGKISGVNSLSFSPSGMSLASGSVDGTVCIWDRDTKHMATQPYKHPSGVQGVVFSPDGLWVATACRDGNVYLWDTGDIILDITEELMIGEETNNIADSIVHNDIRPTSLVDSMRVNAAATLLWLERETNLMTGSPVAELLSEQRSMYSSADRSCHQSISDSEVGFVLHGIPTPYKTPFISRQFRPSTFHPELMSRLRLHTSAPSREPAQKLSHADIPRALAFSSDAKRLVVGTEGANVLIWNLQLGTAEQTLKSSGMEAVFAVAISRDGKRVASGGADNTVRIWNVQDGGPPIECSGHRDWIQTLDFSQAPDGPLLASGSLDQTARLWRASTGQLGGSVWSHKGYVFKTAFSPDYEKLVAGSGDGTISVWDVWADHDEPVRTRTAPSNRCLALSPDGKVVATSNGDGSIIELRNLEGESVRRVGRGFVSNINSLCFSPDGHFLASGSYDGFVTIWDIQDGMSAAEPFRNTTLPIQAIAFSPDGHFLASACGNCEVCIWDVSDIVPLRILEEDNEVVPSQSQSTVTGANDVASTHSGSRQESRSLVSTPNAVSEQRPSTNTDQYPSTDDDSFMNRSAVPGARSRSNANFFDHDGNYDEKQEASEESISRPSQDDIQPRRGQGSVRRRFLPRIPESVTVFSARAKQRIAAGPEPAWMQKMREKQESKRQAQRAQQQRDIADKAASTVLSVGVSPCSRSSDSSFEVDSLDMDGLDLCRMVCFPPCLNPGRISQT